MVGITALWLPIVLSAVLVFVASTLVHMVLRYHWGDWAKLPDEDRVLAAMREAGVRPGSYHFPRPASPKGMHEAVWQEKCKRGPVGFLHVLPSGGPAMGKNLALWFGYTLVVGVFVAYLASRTLDPGADYLEVFRIAGATAFLAYAGAEPVASIWKGVEWSTTLKHLLDGLIYALVTAGPFAWLWPG